MQRSFQTQDKRWHAFLASAFFTLGLIMSWSVGGAAMAIPTGIDLPSRQAFPESVTSTADGSLYIGSVADGGIVIKRPGSAVIEQWVKPGYFGSASIFGVLSDERSQTLWACSNDMSAFGIENPGSSKASTLIGFDLKTAKGKIFAPLPGDKASCNDIAVGSDGSVYVTNISMGEIQRLKPGSSKLEVWSTDPGFSNPDGIAFGGDGNLYVNMFRNGDFYQIAVKPDGTAGKVAKLNLSRPLAKADGMRSLGGNAFVLVEGTGRLDRLTIQGSNVVVETLKDGLSGPTGVTVIDDIAWVTEGQLPFLFDPTKRGKQNLPFRILAVPLAKR